MVRVLRSSSSGSSSSVPSAAAWTRVRIAGVCRSYLVMFHDANELKNHLKVGMLIPADLAGCPLSG